MTRDAPTWLAPSARTDLALLLSGRKPAARLLAKSAVSDIRRWARRRGLFVSGDGSDYVVLACRGAISRRAINLDGRPGRHTFALGRMLGYPDCCSRAAARSGDEGIDRLAVRIGSRRFHGRFKAIDPIGYRYGRSLLAHVPCSHRCVASLAISSRAARC